MTTDESFDEICKRLAKSLGKTPDLNGLLFLIGISELGKIESSYTKEQKQDLMHIATCRLLSSRGIYKLQGTDSDGWPIWIQSGTLPPLNHDQQEQLLKECVIEYFSRLD